MDFLVSTHIQRRLPSDNYAHYIYRYDSVDLGHGVQQLLDLLSGIHNHLPATFIIDLRIKDLERQSSINHIQAIERFRDRPGCRVRKTKLQKYEELRFTLRKKVYGLQCLEKVH